MEISTESNDSNDKNDSEIADSKKVSEQIFGHQIFLVKNLTKLLLSQSTLKILSSF